ncbi:putative Ig domain-containing protein [Geoalkalibacter halelectricus]|uniref:putative Ig domain-containing protein n=1 Tax=Geoalkalibacter halelectricus TaxID=2847045 RepID=UPI003D1D4C58
MRGWDRRLVWLGLFLFAFLTLAGCGGGGSSGSSGQNGTDNTLTLAADPGPDLTVFIGTDVPLDGSASKGESLSFQWSFASPSPAPSPSVATISKANESVAIFRAEQVGDFGVRLTVSQGSQSDFKILNIKAIYPSNPPNAPGDPDAPERNYTTRMITADFGGPIGALESTSDGGAVTVVEVSTGAQTSIARLSKFSAGGDLVAGMDFGESGTTHRPVAALEISPQEYALVGVANYDENGFGDIFVAFADFSPTSAEKSFFKLSDLGKAFLSSATLAPNGEIVVAGTIVAEPPLNDLRMLFVKIDREGEIIFEWEGTAPSAGRAALPTSDNNLLVLGNVVSSNGTHLDIFLALLDAEASILLQSHFGGLGDDYPLAVQTTGSGFLVVGSTNSPAINEGKDDYDIFFLEVGLDGSLKWDEAKLLGLPGLDEFPTALLKLSETEFVIAGAARVENKGFDAYLAWIDLSKENLLVRERIYGGVRDDLALSIAAANPEDSGFYVSGLADGEMTKFDSPRSYSLSGTPWIAEMTATGNVRPSSAPIPDFSRESAMPFVLNVSTFFYDISGDTLSFEASGYPNGLTLNSDNQLIGVTPVVETTTPYKITVTATDPEGLSAEETFTLTIHPRAD